MVFNDGDGDGLITGRVKIWRRNRGSERINRRFSFAVARRRNAGFNNNLL